MCPIIMFSSEALASDIQRYTQTLVRKTTELNIEKHKADTLLFQVAFIDGPKHSNTDHFDQRPIVNTILIRMLGIYYGKLDLALLWNLERSSNFKWE